jgi:hypothetical protein
VNRSRASSPPFFEVLGPFSGLFATKSFFPRRFAFDLSAESEESSLQKREERKKEGPLRELNP